MAVTIEQVLDKIAEALIQSPAVNPDIVKSNQKTIKQGFIQIGRDAADTLVLYQHDRRANSEDLIGGTLQNLIDNESADTIQDIDIIVADDGGTPPQLQTITLNGQDITALITGTGNPLNVGQFIRVQEIEEDVNPVLAEENIDSNIFELLPDLTLRQQQIDKFFNDFQVLSGEVPDFNITDGMVSDDFSAENYHLQHDITAPQEDGDEALIPEPEAFITRLDSDDNNENSGKTLQSLRDQLNEYLKDVDETPRNPEDLRPEYENQSSGYLKFRQLNQGIIVRNTNQPYVEGLDPDTRDYLETGFTITMWVRFIDKVSEGTLFNFGNPLRQDNAMGFKLDTFVLSPDSPTGLDGQVEIWNPYGANNPTMDVVDGYESTISDDNPNGALFTDTDSERFVRLIVYDNDAGKTYDSHTANPHNGKQNFTPMPNVDGITGSNILTMFNNVKVPYKPNEWYFICATFNPDVDEDNSFDSVTTQNYDNNSDFWNGNINLDGSYTHYSGYGNKCKVEIISRTDLLRARGYKV